MKKRQKLFRFWGLFFLFIFVINMQPLHSQNHKYNRNKTKLLQMRTFESPHYKIVLQARRFAQGNLLFMRLWPTKKVDRILTVRADNGQLVLNQCSGRKKHHQPCYSSLWAYKPEGKPGKKRLQVSLLLKDGSTTKSQETFYWGKTKYPRITGDVNRLKRISRFPNQQAEDQYHAHEKLKKKVIAHVTTRKWQGRFMAPLRGPIYGRFYLRRWYGRKLGPAHTGIDYIVPRGRKIKAINSGVVALVIHHYYHGNTTIIDHGEGLYSFYLHQHRVFVQPGQKVRKGLVIGEVGNSGSVSSTAHLHLGVTFRGLDVDPLSVLPLID